MRIRDFALSAALLVACASPVFVAAAHAEEYEINNASRVMFAQNDRVQRAFDNDFCVVDADMPVSDAYATLTNDADRNSYAMIEDALNADFAATNGSDGEVEHVFNVFCDNMSER